MAIREDAASEYAAWTTNLPAWNAMTIMGWVYISTNRGAGQQQFFQNDDGGGAGAYAFHDNLVLTLWTNAASTTGTTLSTGTWYHVALVCDTANAYIYLNGVQDVTRGMTSFTPNAILCGGASQYLNGRHAAVKIWSAALTIDQVKAEMQTIRPQRIANLWGVFPLWNATDTRDLSGFGHTTTFGGSLTVEDGPPVGWGAAPYIIGNPAAGRVIGPGTIWPTVTM